MQSSDTLFDVQFEEILLKLPAHLIDFVSLLPLHNKNFFYD